MKHVRALSTEPPLLAQYRGAHPNEELRPPNEAASTWSNFRDASAAYRELLLELAKAQQGLCLYCEQRLVDAQGALVANDYQVEHVQAKAGAAGRVLNWTNLALACTGGTYPNHPEASRQYTTALNTSCGQTKQSDELPAGCDPRQFPIADAPLEVGMDGKLEVNAPHCAAAGLQAAALEEAIRLLNLNCERLRKARQDRRDNVTAWLVSLLQEVLASAHLSAAQRQQMLGLFIAGRLQPDDAGYLREFWTTERSALGSDAGAWVANHQGLFR